MKNWLPCICIILFLLSCDEFESGDPPTFDGFDLTALAPDQVAVTWEPAEDDFLEPEELVYGIWFALPGEALDPEADPDITTGEGAQSYNLTGLAASTNVEVLVRARERGNGNFSENNTPKTIRTLAEGEGRYGPAIEVALDDQPDDLIHGEVFSSDQAALGVVFSRRIEWLTRNNSGEFVFESERTLEINQDILEAHLVPVRGSLDDLFILRSSGLLFYQNRQTNSGAIFEDAVGLSGTVPAPGTLTFTQDEDENLLISFVNTQGVFEVFSLGEDNDDGFTEVTFTVNSQFTTDQKPFLTFIDNDTSEQFYDLAVYGPQGLRFALDDDEQFRVEPLEEVQNDDDVPSGTDVWVYLDRLDSDNLIDLLVFARNNSEDDTRLWVYQGRSEGFENRVENDYEAAFFENPTLADINDDGQVDLLLPQTSSNNIAVFEGPSLRFGEVARYEGGDDGVERVAVANFDGANANDLAILAGTSAGYRLIFLLANPQ